MNWTLGRAIDSLRNVFCNEWWGLVSNLASSHEKLRTQLASRTAQLSRAESALSEMADNLMATRERSERLAMALTGLLVYEWVETVPKGGDWTEVSCGWTCAGCNNEACAPSRDEVVHIAGCPLFVETNSLATLTGSEKKK